MTGPTYLYRLYDAAGVLLYVGISHDAEVRRAQHAHTQPWGWQVVRMVAELLDTRHDARLAEAEAIRREGPRYNVRGGTYRPGPGAPEIPAEPEAERVARIRSVQSLIANAIGAGVVAPRPVARVAADARHARAVATYDRLAPRLGLPPLSDDTRLGAAS